MNNSLKNIPIYLCKVEAGFPSPADNYVEQRLDIKKYLVKNSEATFFVKATGESMIDIGIFPGDILVVDKSIKPKHNSIIIISIDGELMVKRLIKNYKKKYFYLQSENSKYPDITIKSEDDITVWGVVTYSIHHII